MPSPLLLPRRLAGHRTLLVRLILSFLLAASVWGCNRGDIAAPIRKMHESGDYKGSLEPLRELLRDHNDNPELLFLYGRALAFSGRVGLSEWSLREAMKDPKWTIPAGHQLAFGAIATKNYPTAIETLTQLLSLEPDNVDFLVMRANAYAHSGLHYDEALVDVDQVLKLDPDNLKALEPKIFALLSQNKSKEAATAIEELGRRIDENELGEQTTAWHCATTAIFAGEDGKPALAEKRWTRCLKKYPAHPNVVAGALKYYDGLGDANRSLAILMAAQKAKPDSRDYRVRLAQRMRQAGRTNEAKDLLFAATETDDATAAAIAWTDVAQHYQELGDSENATKSLKRSIEFAKQVGEVSPKTLLSYADSLVLSGHLDRAVEVTKTMKLQAHREMILGRVAQERKRYSEALEHYEIAFPLWPDNTFGRYYGALAAEQLGKFDLAIEYYRFAIRISPGATDARLRLARLNRAEGHIIDGLQTLRTDIANSPVNREGELLTINLWASLGWNPNLQAGLKSFRAHHAPAEYGLALAEAAKGVRLHQGPMAALQMLDADTGFDPISAGSQPALRLWVQYAVEAGQRDQAEAKVAAQIKALPHSSSAHAIRGFFLEITDSPQEEARAAYSRALAFDPENAQALAGLARLTRASDPEAALALFNRAAKADPDDVLAPLEVARILIDSGRVEKAMAGLSRLLEDHPYEPRAAYQLAHYDLEHKQVSDRTLDLAMRGTRFGRGPSYWELLAQVHSARAETQKAAQASERADLLRHSKLNPAAGDTLPGPEPASQDPVE